jgi:filamin
MQLARQQFGIPLILRPEHLASTELDDMSAITYLSYYIKVGSPGYNATLQHIQPMVTVVNSVNIVLNVFLFNKVIGQFIIQLVS